MSWEPSARWGIRVASVMTAAVLVIWLTALLVGAREVDGWLRAADVALLALTTLGVAVAWARSQVEARGHWWLVTAALGGFAFSELILSLGISPGLEEHWPTPADVGALVFLGCMIAFLVRHLRSADTTTIVVHLLDAALMALAITFLLWELVISRGVGEPSELPLITQILVVLYPALDVLIATIVLLLLLIDRSPARVLMLMAMIALAVGDTVASANVLQVTNASAAVSSIGRIVGVMCLVGALAVPAGARLTARRPTLPRLLLVHGLVTAGIWLATWRYVINDGRANGTTAIIGMLLGVLWLSAQYATFRQAGKWAEQVHVNLDELRTAELSLRQLLDDLPDAVVVLARDGRIIELNANSLALTGCDRDDLLGRYFVELFDGGEHTRLFDLWRLLRHGADMVSPTLSFVRPDGTEVVLEANANLPLRDPDRVVIALRDVTVRLAEAHRLEKARERFRLAFHGAPTGMALSTSPGGVLIDVNGSLMSMLGRTREDLIGRTVEEISHPDDWQRNAALRSRASEQDSNHYRMEKRYVRGDGGLVWARTWVSIMDDGEGGSLAIAHIEDVTEQRHNAERLEWAATHDGLTGLPNRFRFLERLGSYLETAQPGSIAVLFIDIDNFKVINDSLGHDAGDQLLRSMSERLRSVVRDRDMLGRFGGDEFIIMLRDVSGGYDPFVIAEQLRAEIAQPLIIDGAELFVTASIGITVSDREGVTTTEMLRDADAAMYRAKSRGRDCVEVFAPGSHDATVLTLRTTNELRRGLERGEIVPYYQPIVQLGNGHLVGFEVLARWRHPERGLLGPDQFLPMAEETGLIGEVGAAVLRSSLAQLGQWRNSTQRFNDLSVSVNVSVRQLMSSQLVDIVAEALAEAGVSAGALWLEITETALMADVKAATIALRELRSLGLHLAVDDFGTGYSSLTYLKRFPVEAIKGDRTFVNGLGIDQEDSTIVEAVVNLGHSLGLSVVAEGVETPLQLSRLREIGCDRGQGYLFGRPRPAELVEAEYSLA
ncbi:MAG: EAL domain-containing protein [Ilumatobacteraceae bacterium]|nr:EAL domain-containing protein [Ilumatobacteraceae bacterium]